MVEQAENQKTAVAAAKTPAAPAVDPVVPVAKAAVSASKPAAPVKLAAKSENLRLVETVPEPPVDFVKKPPAPKKKKKSLLGHIFKLRLRHIIISATFFWMVFVPASAGTLYLAFIASDQYHSSASFSIRSIDSPQASDLLGMFAQSGSASTITESYILLDFILSERMVRDVESNLPMEAMFAPRGYDFFYGMRGGLPIEKKLAYWRQMVKINFDHSTGIMNLEVRAFTPEDSRRIADFIIRQSERLVNELSSTARNEVLKMSRSEVQTVELRLQESRLALRDYRDLSQEADPREGAKMAAELIGGLEKQLVNLRTELSTTLAQMSQDTPRVRLLRAQIASIEAQVQQERQRFGSGAVGKQGRNSGNGQDVATRMQEYETLQTEREFAERAYTSALASLEKARIEADAKQRYLAVFIKPSLSELAQYPARFFNSFLIFMAALFGWGVLVMAYYNIRDRN